jgi:hypothetical protein
MQKPSLYTTLLLCRMYRMSGLLTHALEQEVGLPVARLLVSVRTAPQPFELAPGRGLEDGLKRLDERHPGSLGQGPRLPPEDLLRHLAHGLFCSHERVLFLLRPTPRFGKP